MTTVFEFLTSIHWWMWILIVLAIVAVRDVFIQKKHTISHNFPIVGHLRYWLESIGPELRQY
ncbi:MAG TPA: FMN-binding glutamate synthase family protein, partial [Mangrovimonas sp.]|nr:FMN-binding glutamate synthase family protein [Mangrovimonas sp.]